MKLAPFVVPILPRKITEGLRNKNVHGYNYSYLSQSWHFERGWFYRGMSSQRYMLKKGKGHLQGPSTLEFAIL